MLLGYMNLVASVPQTGDSFLVNHQFGVIEEGRS
jgi:hypothetical protein